MSKPALNFPKNKTRQRKLALWASRTADITATKTSDPEARTDMEAWADAFGKLVNIIPPKNEP